MSTWNNILKAANELNSEAISSMNGFTSLNDWFEKLGLETTDMGDEIGWDVTSGAKNIIDIYCERADLRVEGDRAYAIRPDGEIELLNTENDAEIRGKDYWGGGHEALIHDFYDCIATGRRFPIDSHEGGKSVEEFSAIYESSKLGEEVIIKRK